MNKYFQMIAKIDKILKIPTTIQTTDNKMHTIVQEEMDKNLVDIKLLKNVVKVHMEPYTKQ